MESIFELSNQDGGSYLLNLMHSFGCSYICLWEYDPLLSCLYFKHGFYDAQATADQPSSSSGSLAGRLFDDYKGSFFHLANDQHFVPGLAFKHRNPYLEQHESELQMLAATESQRQFYLEARIKIAVFMGCDKGEIELGMSYVPQMNMEMKMRELFPQDFLRQQQRQSPTSSLSSNNPDEYSSLLFLQEQIKMASITNPNPQALSMPTLISQFQSNSNIIPTFPTHDSTDATLIRAFLAVLSSSPSQMQQPINVQETSQLRTSAFRRYDRHAIASTGETRPDLMRQTMLKRGILYSRQIHSHRRRSINIQNLQHMISERRRREKLNESFEALRSILPPGTKKSRATILKTAIDCLTDLKAQLEGENVKNQNQIQIQNQNQQGVIIRTSETTSKDQEHNIISTDHHTENEERLNVRIVSALESMSRDQGRMVELQVRLRSGHDHASATSLIIRVLEFLKQVREASFVSMEAQTLEAAAADQNPTHMVNFRLRIEGEEWDEAVFTEAIRRILADLAQ